jgi:hypothetical protein
MLIFCWHNVSAQHPDFLFDKKQKPVVYVGTSDFFHLYLDTASIETLKTLETTVVRMVVAGIQFKDIFDKETKITLPSGRRTYLEIMVDCYTRKTIILSSTSYKLFGEFENYSIYNIDEIEVRYFDETSPLFQASKIACNRKKKIWSFFK